MPDSEENVSSQTTTKTFINPETGLSHEERRRQQKKQVAQKRFQNISPHLKTIWQILVSFGIFATGAWVVSQPYWEIRSPDQIEVQGTKLLSPQQLKTKIFIDYPKYIYRLQTQEIANQLEKKAPVYDVAVRRSLFPPRVIVIVRERQPVAIATINGQVGYLDFKGVWTSAKSYPTGIKKPDIEIVGANKNVLQDWRMLYGQISRSPVKISKLDFRAVNNLILSTDLGLVHCGAYSNSKIEAQIQMLNRLRSLPKSTPKLKFTHIDLVNPNFPVLDGVTPLKPTEAKP